MNERKWQQPQFQLHLVTKSCGRWWELGLPTSAPVHLRKMPCTMIQPIQTFCEQCIYWMFPLLFSPQIDFPFTIFVRSLYRSSATFKFPPSFWLCALILGYAVRNFSHQWRKICDVLRQWCKPVKDSATPAEAGREMEDSHTRQLTDSLEVSPFSTRSRYSCLISRSRRDGRPGYMVEPPDSTMCL